MTHTLTLLPAIGCVAMMLGAGVIGRALSKTPFLRGIARRLPTFSRHAAPHGHAGRPAS